MAEQPPSSTRRDFIRQAACAAVGTFALTNTIRDLRLINAAVAQGSTPPDYKALICVFLSGGNDANNLIVPTSATEYANYASIRSPILAVPQGSLVPLVSSGGTRYDFGFHPSCPQLGTLFGEDHLAPLFNVGTLVQPITRAQYQSKSIPTPPQLFSHADQVTQWQTSIPDRPPTTGWGGRCADLIATQVPLVQPDAKISLSVTLAGANTFEVGNVVTQYSVSTSGAIALAGVTGARLAAFQNILGIDKVQADMQTQAYANVLGHALDTGALLNGAISATAGANYWTNPFPNTTLGNQLKMIARLIQAGPLLNMKRQIFFCQVGGYDLHNGQTQLVNNTPDTTKGSHATLLAELSQCFFALQRATEQIGLGSNVTTFTASDFGRTCPSNGYGSDHGWGSHHLVMGGAVKGGKTYGTFPTLAINGPDDTSTGRWIPTTSVDQYSATLASWFGVGDSDLKTVFPNLDRFATPKLGFI